MKALPVVAILAAPALGIKIPSKLAENNGVYNYQPQAPTYTPPTTYNKKPAKDDSYAIT